MKRLTRLVVLVGARFAAALAAVVVVSCIYCRLTTDAVFGPRLPRLAAVAAYLSSRRLLWRAAVYYLSSEHAARCQRLGGR